MTEILQYVPLILSAAAFLLGLIVMVRQTALLRLERDNAARLEAQTTQQAAAVFEALQQQTSYLQSMARTEAEHASQELQSDVRTDTELLLQKQMSELREYVRAALESVGSQLRAATQESLDRSSRIQSQQVAQLQTQLADSLAQLRTGTQDSLSRTAESQAKQLAQLQSQLADSLQQLDKRIESLRQTTGQSLADLRRSNDQQLTEMRRTVDDKLTETLDKHLNASFSQVSERLEQVYKGLGEMQTLATGVGDLKKVLTNVNTRGIWGEMQLGSLLEQLLAPNQYAENIEVVPGSRERVEFAIRLPGQDSRPTYLAIDSKFPREDYERLVTAGAEGDPAAVETARKALYASIRTEARRIQSKYIQTPYTTDFAVMFLPVEGLYAEVVRDMEAVDAIQREQRVVIAGPSTFAALLNALQMGFRTLAIQKRSSEVWQLLGAVKNDFTKFGAALEKTQQRLRQATESIDSAYKGSRRIQDRLADVESASVDLGLPPLVLPED